MTNSGRNRLLRVERPEGDEVFLAHPRRSLHARRKPNAAWQVVADTLDDAERSYRQQSSAIDDQAFWLDLPEDLSGERPAWIGNVQRSLIRRFEYDENAGARRLRIELENNAALAAQGIETAASFELAPDDQFSLQRFEFGTQQLVRGELEYDRHNGVPVLKTLTTVSKGAEAQTTTTTTRVVERSFEPAAEEQFTAEAVIGPAALAVSQPAGEAPRAWPWYYLPLFAAGASLVVGLALLKWPSR